MIDAGNVRHARINARRDYHMIEPGCRKLCRINALTEFDRHGILLEHRTVVAQGLVKLFLARHLLGQVELPTDLIGRIKQSHGMPTFRGHGRISESGRPCAYHPNILSRCRRAPLDHGLVTGARIHET